jgi:hypothetical protein
MKPPAPGHHVQIPMHAHFLARGARVVKNFFWQPEAAVLRALSLRPYPALWKKAEPITSSAFW